MFHGNNSPSGRLKMKTLNETSRSRQKSELGLCLSPKDVFLQNISPVTLQVTTHSHYLENVKTNLSLAEVP
jgi:hypothetical protein